MEEIEKKIDYELREFFKEYELHRIKSSFLEKAGLFIIAAVSFVTALAWSDAMKDIFDDVFGGRDTIPKKVLFALILTAITTMISFGFGRLMRRRKQK